MIIIVYIKKKNKKEISLCPLRHSGGGGLKAVADMSTKNVSFFWDCSPYQAIYFGETCQITRIKR